MAYEPWISRSSRRGASSWLESTRPSTLTGCLAKEEREKRAQERCRECALRTARRIGPFKVASGRLPKTGLNRQNLPNRRPQSAKSDDLAFGWTEGMMNLGAGFVNNAANAAIVVANGAVVGGGGGGGVASITVTMAGVLCGGGTMGAFFNIINTGTVPIAQLVGALCP